MKFFFKKMKNKKIKLFSQNNFSKNKNLTKRKYIFFFKNLQKESKFVVNDIFEI